MLLLYKRNGSTDNIHRILLRLRAAGGWNVGNWNTGKGLWALPTCKLCCPSNTASRRKDSPGRQATPGLGLISCFIACEALLILASTWNNPGPEISRSGFNSSTFHPSLGHWCHWDFVLSFFISTVRLLIVAYPGTLVSCEDQIK